ncbi:MAG TPA: septal ring lytic transglycosylase RlpA family protein [Stellaceae bacterium]|nr:septal ring lytic transglycosylase RlpA family protein [Stellaceae bacterium]
MIAAFAAALVAPWAGAAHAGTYANSGLYGGSLIKASWYSSGYRTASGEHFNPNGLTAAHRSLPFGTRLAVTNPANGRTVIVRINDRGPFVRGVGLDLSRGAAFALGMRGTGVVRIARAGGESYAGSESGAASWQAEYRQSGRSIRRRAWHAAQNEPRHSWKSESGSRNVAERFWGSPFEQAAN